MDTSLIFLIFLRSTFSKAKIKVKISEKSASSLLKLYIYATSFIASQMLCKFKGTSSGTFPWSCPCIYIILSTFSVTMPQLSQPPWDNWSSWHSPLMAMNRLSWFFSGFPCSYALWASSNVWISCWILNNNSTSAIFPNSSPSFTLVWGTSRTICSWTQWTDQWHLSLMGRGRFLWSLNRSLSDPAPSHGIQNSCLHALYTTGSQLWDRSAWSPPLFPEEVLDSIRRIIWNKDMEINIDEIIAQIIEWKTSAMPKHQIS